MSRVFCNFDWALLSSLGACLHRRARARRWFVKGFPLPRALHGGDAGAFG